MLKQIDDTAPELILGWPPETLEKMFRITKEKAKHCLSFEIPDYSMAPDYYKDTEVFVDTRLRELEPYIETTCLVQINDEYLIRNITFYGDDPLFSGYTVSACNMEDYPDFHASEEEISIIGRVIGATVWFPDPHIMNNYDRKSIRRKVPHDVTFREYEFSDSGGSGDVLELWQVTSAGLEPEFHAGDEVLIDRHSQDPHTEGHYLVHEFGRRTIRQLSVDDEILGIRKTEDKTLSPTRTLPLDGLEIVGQVREIRKKS